MNKPELVTAISQNAGISRRDAENALRAALEAISGALEQGEPVKLSGFGSFETRLRPAKPGRDPRTKQTIEIPAAQVPVFRPSKTLKDRVDGKEKE